LTDLRLVRALLLSLAAALALPAFGQVLYKLIDRQGRVTYSDREPKNFDGTVIRLDPDTISNIVPSAAPAEAAPKAGAAPGIAENRRRIREELEAKLRAAQARAEAARKAKAEGGEPLPDEMQDHPASPSPAQVRAATAESQLLHRHRSERRPFLNCPTRVPQDAFYERQKKLEDDLKRAEDELELAERAYRRGTD